MKLSRITAAIVLAASAALPLSGCAMNELAARGGDGPQLSGRLAGSGASSQGTAQTAWIAGFAGEQPRVQINYAGGGSGAGRTDFQNGTSQFVGSDRPFKAEEIEAGGFAACAEGSDLVEIPAYISPIAIAFTLEGVDALKLDPATVAGVFTGEIARWNDERIAAQNPGVPLPDLAITPVHRADKSGTTGSFTAYLDGTAPEAWPYGQVEEWPLPGGEAAQETPGVQNAIKAGNGTIGYLDNSAAADFAKVEVKVGEQYVPLSSQAAAAIVDAAAVQPGRAPSDLALEPVHEQAGAYPIVLVSYLIGCARYADPAVGELVRSYFGYVVSEAGQTAAAQIAYSAPMPAALRERATAVVEQIS